MLQKKLVVIGGGAAGFFCAVNAARLRPDMNILLLEKTNKVLSKVRVSGGGRCNVTHACFAIEEMSRRYPRGGNFVKKTFHQFFTPDTISWFEQRGVKLKTENDGRMFPVSDSSQTIIDCLLNEADKFGVKIKMSTEVSGLNCFKDAHENQRIRIDLNEDQQVEADYICIACGGYPKIKMFDWLIKLGHHVENPIPSLFTFNIPRHPITELMGISVANVTVKITGTKLVQEGPILITHWGLSGPVVLKLSAWGARELAIANYDFTIVINWLPEYTEQQLSEKLQMIRFQMASQKVINKNPFNIPQRLWSFFVQSSLTNTEVRWADLSAKEQNKLSKNICAAELNVKGKTTFKEEFVTAGGIRLNEVDHKTMMSKKAPNIFFAGEILDVDGITGGFNFQHAWTSSFIAAKTIASL